MAVKLCLQVELRLQVVLVLSVHLESAPDTVRDNDPVVIVDRNAAWAAEVTQVTNSFGSTLWYAFW